MQTRDWLTLIALVLGPVLAVVISLVMEASRRTRENRLRIVRMLLATRHMPAHADFAAAINLVPVEFNSKPEVITAWRNHFAAVTRPAAATPEERAAHTQLIEVRKARLIFEAMKATGLKGSEGDIQMEAYISQGFVDRDALYLRFLEAMPQVADALKTQAETSRRLLENIEAARAPRPLQQDQVQGPAHE